MRGVQHPGAGHQQRNVITGALGQQRVEHGLAGLLRRPAGVLGQRVAQQPDALVEIPVPVLDEPVGEEHQPGLLGQLPLPGLEGQPAEPEGRAAGHIDGLGSAVRQQQHGLDVPGARHGAFPGRRVIDRIEAGGSGDRTLGFLGALVLVDTGDEFVEVPEDLVGRQVQGGEVVNGGAQPAHGGRGVQSVPHDIADDERHPGTGQRDDVEPVAADAAEPAAPGLCGQIAVGGLDGVLLRQPARQQTALQGDGHGVLAGVAAGIVDAHRGAGGQFLGEGEFLVLERLRFVRAPEDHHAEDDATGAQRHRDPRMDAVRDDLPGPAGTLEMPAGERRQIRFEGRFAAGEAGAEGGGRLEADQLADGVEAAVRRGAAGGRPPHLDGRAGGSRRLLADQHVLGQVDGDDIGEPGGAELREFLAGAHHVESGADLRAGVVEQLQAAAGHIGAAGERPQLGGVP